MMFFSKKVSLLIFIVVVSLILLTKFVLPTYPFLIAFSFITFFYIITMSVLNNSKNIEFYIFLPFLISAVQNVYLGINIHYINEMELKILLSLHMFLLYGLFISYYFVFSIEKKIILILLKQCFLY